MGLFNTITDIGLTLSNVATVIENHTEAKTPEERKAKQDRRRAVSDARNIAYVIKRITR